MYSVHIAYIWAFRNTPFIYLEIVYLPLQDQRILRALVKYRRARHEACAYVINDDNVGTNVHSWFLNIIYSISYHLIIAAL